jgi:hypothetical protein
VYKVTEVISPAVVRLANVVDGRPLPMRMPVNVGRLLRVELGPLPVREGKLIEVQQDGDVPWRRATVLGLAPTGEVKLIWSDTEETATVDLSREVYRWVMAAMPPAPSRRLPRLARDEPASAYLLVEPELLNNVLEDFRATVKARLLRPRHNWQTATFFTYTVEATKRLLGIHSLISCIFVMALAMFAGHFALIGGSGET